MRAGHAAVLVEIDLDFVQRQLERPAFEPPRSQQHGQLVHPRHKLEDLGRQLVLPFLPVRQIIVDFFVRKPPPAADRGRVQIDGDRNPVGRELDERRLCVSHPIGLQARQTVRDQLRQHRQHTVGQVDARAALSPRDRALSPAARSARRRRYARPAASGPFRSRTSEIASSKSRASTGSIVMTTSPVKSVRPCRIDSSKLFGLDRAPLPARRRRILRAN